MNRFLLQLFSSPIRVALLMPLLLLVPIANLAQGAKPGTVVSVRPEVAPSSAPIVSLAEYRGRLQAMDALVAACQKAISSANCSSETVPAELQVTPPAGSTTAFRTVRFGWLHKLLDEAAHYDPAKEKAATKPAPPTPASASPATEAKPERKLPVVDPQPDEEEGRNAEAPLPIRLQRARDRLQEDQQLAAQAATGSPKGNLASSVASDATTQRKALAAILDQKEYKSATVGRTLKDRILEKIARFINHVIIKLIGVGAKSKWIGITTEIGFVVLLCVALVWLFIRLEKQGRFSPSLYRGGPGGGAASERDWQLWLRDAREAAAQRAWRDAIHYLYWASISRLESSGEWPADRARTPREYLALLSDQDVQRAQLKAGLTSLTRSFERTWYAGRPAAESDFLQAQQLAAALGAKSAPAGPGEAP